MEIDQWINRLKECKSQRSWRMENIEVKGNVSRTIQTIYKAETCQRCEHTKIHKELNIEFKQTHHLTVFEGWLLYSIFYLNQIPQHYGKYHECIAGKRFIENIKSINGG